MKKFDKQELHTIKIALVQRCYHLDDLILKSDGAMEDFLNRERRDCLEVIKKIDS